MIATLCLNPTVDDTAEVERLVMGGEARALSHRQDPGGKGVNVARVIHRLGGPTRVYGIAAGRSGELLEDLLDREGVPHRFTHVRGETRINFTIRQLADQVQCRVLMQGPQVSEEAVTQCLDELTADLPETSVLVMSGALPPGCPEDVYAEMIRRAKAAGVPCYLDTHGKPLRLGLSAGPAVIKPNRAELGELTGRAVDSIPAVVSAARGVLAPQMEAVLVSLGAEGAVLVTADGTWRLPPPEVSRWFAAGAGDSLLAAYALARSRGASPLEAAIQGVAAGTSAVLAESSRLARSDDVARLAPRVVPHPIEGPS
jgi:6-phosphofructokinase 2